MLLRALGPGTWNVLRSVTEQRLWTLDDPGLFVSEGLVKPHKANASLRDALALEFGCSGPFATATAAVASVWGSTARGDLVAVDDGGVHIICEVLKHIEFETNDINRFTFVRALQFKCELHARCSLHAVTDEHFWVRTQSILCSVIWAGVGSDKRILRPVYVRPQWVPS